MPENIIPNHAVPVLHALARCHGPAGFAELKEMTGLTQPTLNRILKNLCLYNYAIKTGHGQYMVGAELLDMGQEITRNHVVAGFDAVLSSLQQKTHLNAELYMITPNGPVYLTHYATRGEAGIPLRFGHLIRNRKHHPASLFYLAIHESQKVEGYKENFIVDRGGQWPELFRSGAMVPKSNYCLIVSGLLANIDEDRQPELKNMLHEACQETELPGQAEPPTE
jgi:hypothetical protein